MYAECMAATAVQHCARMDYVAYARVSEITMMRRYDRSRFLAFGALPVANVAGLLIYGLALATHGTGGAGRSLPALVVIAAVCLLSAMAAAIKRGRDAGWPV